MKSLQESPFVIFQKKNSYARQIIFSTIFLMRQAAQERDYSQTFQVLNTSWWRYRPIVFEGPIISAVTDRSFQKAEPGNVQRNSNADEKFVELPTREWQSSEDSDIQKTDTSTLHDKDI